MTTLLVIGSTVMGAIAGRALLGRWYNHVTMYSLTWGFVLSLYSLDLIHYYPITSVAWVYIGTAWFEIFHVAWSAR